MKAEVEALARHRLSRAREAFAEGEHLLAKDAFMGAVNRVYYGAFHAARGLLAMRQVDSSRHSGVISLFHQHFVRTGVVDAEKAKAFSRAFEKRQKTDYGDFATVTMEEARTVRDEVRAFIEECAQALERLIGEER
ncbi:MAG: HEPN domain-containing protein [Gemmatimonadetes bacterium]|nr:HEPN domain-containing protein [Gemmatimonadota bacterium]